MKNYIKKYFKILLPAILLFFLLRTITSDWQAVLVYLKDFEVIPMILSAGILLLIYPESAFAWYVLIRKIGVRISLKNALYVWIISNISRYLPGSIWQYVGRVELGMQAGIPRQKSILAVLYETLLIIIAGLFVSLFTISYWSTVGIKSYMYCSHWCSCTLQLSTRPYYYLPSFPRSSSQQ